MYKYTYLLSDSYRQEPNTHPTSTPSQHGLTPAQTELAKYHAGQTGYTPA